MLPQWGPNITNVALTFFLDELPLGIPPNDVDTAYVNVRDLPDNEPYRAFVEKLWLQFQDVAEPKFQVNAVRGLQQAFWEMYLYAALCEHCGSVKRAGPAGPDFYIETKGRRIWIEAIAPTPGDGPDAVTPFPSGTRKARRVPEDQILLRFTAAMKEKADQFNRALLANRVQATDAYVVAINSRDIDPYYGGAPPYYQKAFLPIGHPAVAIDPRTGQIVDRMVTYRNELKKANEAHVPTDTFLSGAYPLVSAVLHSRVDCANLPSLLGGDFQMLHNPRAVSIPDDLFAFMKQFRVTTDDNSFSVRELEPKK